MAYVSQEMKKELAVGIKKVLKKYGMKGNIGVRNHMSLYVDVMSGPIDFGNYTHGDGYIQVNTYWIYDHYDGIAKDFLNDLKSAMKGNKWYDNSNAQIDYFDTAYYIDINIGKWNKPYQLNTTKVAA